MEVFYGMVDWETGVGAHDSADCAVCKSDLRVGTTSRGPETEQIPFRAAGKNASTFKKLLAFVPSDVYGSVICGGFTVILEVRIVPSYADGRGYHRAVRLTSHVGTRANRVITREDV